MNKWIDHLNFRSLSIVTIILLIIALLYHLSYTAVIGDECIRSLVAFEMLESGNYLVPTINGVFYYSKPPLYNWFIAFSFYVFGGVNEFSSRFPTIIFTLLFAWSIYIINKRYFNKRFGFLVALMVITSGRILFWDSMLGLIDIGYSLVVYVQIYMIYHFFKQKQYLKLFLFTYLMTAIGFMMKGYPSLAFQAISVGTWFIYKKKFRLLFSLKHIAGIGLLAFIIGGYYYVYSHYNDVQKTMSPLYEQAMMRTASRFQFKEILSHLFSYPFENIYHFLPWTLMSLLLIRKDIIARIKAHPFIEFNAMMFMVNIVIYWLSPEVYPRYVLMLTPLIFTVLLYFYLYKNTIHWSKTILQYFFKILAVILTVATLGMFFIPSVREIAYYQIKIIFLFLSMVFLAYLFLTKNIIKPEDSTIIQKTKSTQNILLFIIMILVVRIGFDTFVLYDRKQYGHNAFYKKEVLRIADLTKDKEINIYKNSRIHFSDAYYLMSERGKSIKHIYTDFKPEEFYILDTVRQEFGNMVKVDSFKTWEFDRTLFLVKLKQ